MKPREGARRAPSLRNAARGRPSALVVVPLVARLAAARADGLELALEVDLFLLDAAPPPFFLGGELLFGLRATLPAAVLLLPLEIGGALLFGGPFLVHPKLLSFPTGFERRTRVREQAPRHEQGRSRRDRHRRRAGGHSARARARGRGPAGGARGTAASRRLVRELRLHADE